MHSKLSRDTDNLYGCGADTRLREVPASITLGLGQVFMVVWLRRASNINGCVKRRRDYIDVISLFGRHK